VRPMSRTEPIDRGLAWLAIATAVVTFLMIVIGAITRTSNSGMGCGTYWPLCNGQVVPEFASTQVAIEYGHRLFALLVAIFVGLVAIQAWRKHRTDPRIRTLAVAGVVLYFLQAGLGAITVALSNQWVSVLLHLINSMLLLACYLVLAVAILNPTPEMSRDGGTAPAAVPVIELVLATALAFLVAIIGAAVAGNGAAKACVGWPLCRGEIWPASQGPYQMLNMLHRLAAGGLGILLLLLVIQVWASHDSVPANLRRALYVPSVLYLVQAALGAFIVLINTPEALFVIRSLHVAVAAATWSAMVVASILGWLQQQTVSMKVEEGLAPSMTTSN